jgi:transcription elongation factor Elf1
MHVTTAQNTRETLRPRKLRCPQCGHCVIRIFENTQGMIQAKCKGCGHETLFTITHTQR